MHRPRSKQSGSALVLALMAVFVVTVLAASFLQLSSAVTQRQAQAVHRKEAFYMAEAGLAEAYAGLMIGRVGQVGTPRAPARFGDGLFWVEAEEAGEDLLQLQSTGMAGGGRARLSLVAKRNERSVGSLGLFSHQALQIPAGTTIDSYDSSEAPYEEPETGSTSGGTSTGGTGTGTTGTGGTTGGTTRTGTTGTGGTGGTSGGGGMTSTSTGATGTGTTTTTTTNEDELARIGSNGAISVTGTSELPTVLDADLTPGAGETVTVTGSVTINGSTSAALATTPLPPIAAPAVAMQTGVSYAGIAPLVVSAGDTGYDYLRVSAGSEVVVQGPARLVLQDLQLGANAQLTIDTTDGRVDIYVTRSLHLAAGSFVSVPGEDPGLVTLQVPGALATPGILAAEGPFYGIVYAPESTLEVSPSFEVFGALIADLLTLTGPLQLHFDRYLASLSNVSAVPSLWSWRIVEISNGAVADPYQLLGVLRTTLRQPSLAHADQTLDIVYVDLADATQSYSGPESGFDWALVKRTITVSRDNEPVPPSGVRSRVSIDMMVQ